MRKFLVPIINLINIILVSIAFGLGSKTAVLDIQGGKEKAIGTYYQLVWNAADRPNLIGMIGFFIFIAAVVLTLAVFIPAKGRKVISLIAGLLLITSGVFFLKTPAGADVNIINPELTGALIAMAVLVIVAGALALGMSVIDLTAKSEKAE